MVKIILSWDVCKISQKNNPWTIWAIWGGLESSQHSNASSISEFFSLNLRPWDEKPLGDKDWIVQADEKHSFLWKFFYNPDSFESLFSTGTEEATWKIIKRWEKSQFWSEIDPSSLNTSDISGNLESSFFQFKSREIFQM